MNIFYQAAVISFLISAAVLGVGVVVVHIIGAIKGDRDGPG